MIVFMVKMATNDNTVIEDGDVVKVAMTDSGDDDGMHKIISRGATWNDVTIKYNSRSYSGKLNF